MTSRRDAAVDRRGFFRSLLGRRPTTSPAPAPAAEPVHEPAPSFVSSVVPGVITSAEPFSLAKFYEARDAASAEAGPDVPPPPRPRGAS